VVSVSRVLNNSRVISDRLRKKVYKATRELDYASLLPVRFVEREKHVAFQYKKLKTLTGQPGKNNTVPLRYSRKKTKPVPLWKVLLPACQKCRGQQVE
jgi:hypothetical protein